MIRSNIDEDIWNNTNQSLMSFVGYESEADGQFRCWDANQTIFNPNFPQPTMGFNQNINPYSEITHHSADFMKREEDQSGFNTTEEADYSMGRIGLKLGHRTYFSSREAAMIDRLFKRPRGFFQATQIPRCQAEGCKVDLTNAKHYHRRHKVCEFHSKAIRVLAGGAEQRFCQQCSRFHLLSEFDEMKRSCRKRLADHNRRRRKSQTGSSDSVSAKNTVNGFAQGSSSSSLNINEMSTSETLLLRWRKMKKLTVELALALKSKIMEKMMRPSFRNSPFYLHLTSMMNKRVSFCVQIIHNSSPPTSSVTTPLIRTPSTPARTRPLHQPAEDPITVNNIATNCKTCYISVNRFLK